MKISLSLGDVPVTTLFLVWLQLTKFDDRGRKFQFMHEACLSAITVFIIIHCWLGLSETWLSRTSTLKFVCRTKFRSDLQRRCGHYMCRTVVTICTAQWSLYEPHSGHYVYRKVVTMCTAQWSLYVPHSGHYMYRTVVTVCTAQCSLYVP